MAVKCENCPLRKLDGFIEMKRDEVSFMNRFKSGELSVEAGATLLMEGSNAPQLYTVLEGMGLRYKLTPEGERQVVNFVFPGDFLGLQAGIMKEMGHSVEAASPMRLCVFNRRDIWTVFRERPERAFDLTWLGAVEEHFLGEALTTLGQRDATASVAWALTRIAHRGADVGLMENGSMPFPFRQRDLADSLGLSVVHTNKTLAKIRTAGLASWSDGRLLIRDLKGLMTLAGVEDRQGPRPLM